MKSIGWEFGGFVVYETKEKHLKPIGTNKFQNKQTLLDEVRKECDERIK